MRPITPCLWFDGNAEEAAKFYTSVFPSSTINAVVRTPRGGAPGNDAGSVLVVEFNLDGREFVGLNGGPQFTFTEAVSFQISCADQAEVDRYWDALLVGGQAIACGWLKDRFGLFWQVFPTRMTELIADPDPGRAERAFKAMMDMQKIDLAVIEAAALG